MMLSSDTKKNESILVVDDEVHLLYLMQEQLKQDGYQIYIAGTAESALQILKDHDDIKLLFSDINLPGGINGCELAQIATEIRPELSVLFTSGFSSDAIKERGLNIADASMLQKPFRHEELSQTIRQVLDKTASTQSHA